MLGSYRDNPPASDIPDCIGCSIFVHATAPHACTRSLRTCAVGYR